MIYVKLRRALSIWLTWPAFLVTKSSYIPSHCGAMARICPWLAAGMVSSRIFAALLESGRCRFRSSPQGGRASVKSRRCMELSCIRGSTGRSISGEYYQCQKAAAMSG